MEPSILGRRGIPSSTVHIVCDWEIPSVLDEARRSSVPTRELTDDDIQKVVGQTVILTGDPETSHFICTTCEEFVSDTWGSSGRATLRLISAAAARACIDKDHKQQPEEQYKSFEPETSVVQYRQVCLFPKLEHFVDVRQFFHIVEWIVAAVRPNAASESVDPENRREELLYSTPKIIRPPGPESSRRVSLLPLSSTLWKEQNVESGQGQGPSRCGCWKTFFRSGVISYRFMAQQRRWGHGVEISFDLMCQLAAIECAYELDGGLVLLGHFTALIPTAMDKITGAVQWHFEAMDEVTTELCINPADLEATKRSWYKTNDLALLRNFKCFVGWLPRTEIMLGTRELLQHPEHNMTWSHGLRTRQRTAHSAGGQAGGQIQGSAAVFAVTYSGLYEWQFVSNRQRFNNDRSYSQALHNAQGKAAFIVDEAAKRAWLVPVLSLILHLCHRYYQELRTTEDPASESPIPFAKPASDGSAAVLRAVENEGHKVILGDDDGKADRETLSQLWLRITHNLIKSNETMEEPRSNVIFAREAMDIVTEPWKGSDLREVPLPPIAAPWTAFAGYASVVCVCANMGLAIRPASKHADKFTAEVGCSCGELPEGHHLLAVSLFCLEQLHAQRCGAEACRHVALGIDKNNMWILPDNHVGCWANCDERCCGIWGGDPARSEALQHLTQPSEVSRGCKIQNCSSGDQKEDNPSSDEGSVSPFPSAGAVVFARKPDEAASWMQRQREWEKSTRQKLKELSRAWVTRWYQKSSRRRSSDCSDNEAVA